jgi:predicted Rossmann fold flavoprotein
MVKDKKIVVIGAGAAGMMAAGQAALNGHDVLLLEKMRRPGRKLAITGKGRCNLTNSAQIADFIASFGKKGRFLRQAFGSFFSNDLVNFFEEIGVPLVTERGGRIFPKSGKAPEVVTALEKWIDKCGVTLQTGSTVQKILIEDNRITGVVANGSKINADAVIIATGGASYPRTGSTGDGYEFAKLAGHTITPIRPALVPLEAKNGTSHLDGLNLRNINAKCFIDGKKFREEFGELTFIDGTVSGPVILKMSGDIVDALRNSQNVEIAIDLKPALEEQKLDRRLVRDFTTRGKEPLKSVLRGLIPKELVGEILANLAIDGNKSVSTITSKERKQIRNWLKNFRIEITGYRPFGEAIITAGGVVTKEVNPKTMESKMVTGLYITGEVLDLNATTGGYNLQAAFSTGYLAGQLI